MPTQDNRNLVLKKSYEVALILLMSISLLTGIRSLDQDISEKTQLSLQLSTLVTVIASFHYFLMNTRKKNLVVYRYLDWFFTTPILLIDYALLNGILTNELVIQLLALNTSMLLIGFLGELGKMTIISSTILGFIPFVWMFYIIYRESNGFKESTSKGFDDGFAKDPNTWRLDPFDATPLGGDSQSNLEIQGFWFFVIFVTLWSMYGLIHMLNDLVIRNVSYNILDILTKGAFGLFIFKKSWDFK